MSRRTDGSEDSESASPGSSLQSVTPPQPGSPEALPVVPHVDPAVASGLFDHALYAPHDSAGARAADPQEEATRLSELRIEARRVRLFQEDERAQGAIAQSSVRARKPAAPSVSTGSAVDAVHTPTGTSPSPFETAVSGDDVVATRATLVATPLMCVQSQ